MPAVYGEVLASVDDDRARTDGSPELDAFFARLRRAQLEFLDTVAQLRELLVRAPCDLPELAAGQNRLAQEFLDAQHSILRRRADVALAVTRILDEAGADARALADCVAIADAPVPGVVTRCPLTTGRPAREALGSTDEMRDELRALVERWWAAERRAGERAVEDAHAGAALRRREARVDVQVPVAPMLPPPALPPLVDLAPARRGSAALPAQVLAALDDVDDAALDRLLASLLDAPALPPPLPEGLPDAPEVEVAELGSHRPLRVIEASAADRETAAAGIHTGADFWREPPPSRSRWRWALVRVVLPTSVVIAAMVIGFAGAGALMVAAPFFDRRSSLLLHASAVDDPSAAPASGMPAPGSVLPPPSGPPSRVDPPISAPTAPAVTESAGVESASVESAAPAGSNPAESAPTAASTTELARLRAEMTDTRRRLDEAQQRAAALEAQVRAATRDQLESTRDQLAAMEGRHLAAIAQLREAAAAEVAKILDEARRAVRSSVDGAHTIDGGEPR